MLNYKNSFLICCLFSCGFCLSTIAQPTDNSYCNPLNLNYRFSYNSPSYREAADPVIHLYKGKYFLYASKSGGYWYGDDMIKWEYRPSKTLPVEDYAPTVETIHDTVFFIASSGAGKIYYNTNPLEDNWKVYNPKFSVFMTDPALFKDEDGRVYLYYGCSSKDPIMGVELNPLHMLDTMGTPKVLIGHHAKEYGWEEQGEENQNGKEGWNEGSWMTKHSGKYYLQYASPGTQFKVYGDGVYQADYPLGPFTYMPNSPFSYKPGGFINGAGHGCTFQDKFGNYCHVATMAISVRNMFERRIGLFPAFFDAEGELHCNTAFGDYPMLVPKRKMDFQKETLSAGWMLLSYKKSITASSSLSGHTPMLACDEEVRTSWSAASGNKGEWLQLDLLKNLTIHAIQVNFTDEGSTLKAGNRIKPYQYLILASTDGISWKKVIDKSANIEDVTHDYVVLSEPVHARFVKLINLQVPDGNFSVSDLRIFGKGKGQSPNAVKKYSILRQSPDTREALLSWTPDIHATGYIVYYGTQKNKLYNSIMVYDTSKLKMSGLNRGVPYFFRVDSFNENGITKGKKSGSKLAELE